MFAVLLRYLIYRYLVNIIDVVVVSVTGSVSDRDLELHSIRIRNADPDPGGVKSAENEGGNQAKRQLIHH
jgi:hypothetical protein